jgi:cobalt-zinc-cadmium efflux system membrane fusion protein
MMEQQSRSMNWPLAAIAVAVAAALGFGAARLSSPDPAPPVTAPAAASGVKEAQPEASGFAEIKIPAEYLKVAEIGVERIGDGGLASEILTAGTVTAALNSEAVIVARASGNVVRVSRQLGDSVKAGDVLAQVESMEAATMTAERNMTSARAELARKVYAREASLFEQGVTPRQDVEAAQAALAVATAEARRATSVARAANLSKDGASLAVVSPIAGKVTAQSVTLGGFVQPQTELFRVSGAGQPLVEASVAAADIGRIAAGDRATIAPASGTLVEATIRSVTPTVSGTTRAAQVLLTPASPVAKLVVGEGVRVRLHLKNNSGGMVVPEDAVQTIDGRDVLFVRTKDGFRPTPVLVGARSGGMAQIVDGVRVGEQVATRNAFLVKADMIKAGKEE